MLTKTISKRDELALQWNTRIEVAARLLVISFSILGTFMGYFISAGCAMAYNNIKNLTGVISHRTYELHYIIAGIVGLICACFFLCFIGLPYVKSKKSASFKSWIIISFEYLADEEQMKQVETKLATLELQRQRLVELETIKYNKEKYSLNHLKEKKKNIYVQKPVLEEQEQEVLKSSKQE